MQDAGALGLLRMLQGQIRKDTKPQPQVFIPLHSNANMKACLLQEKSWVSQASQNGFPLCVGHRALGSFVDCHGRMAVF